MATDIVQGLFGDTPYAIGQAQNNALTAAALQHARLDPIQRAAMGMYQGGGMLGGAAAESMGMVNPEVERARATEAVMSGIDPTNPDAILQRAAHVSDPRLKMRLTQYANQMKAQNQKARLEAQQAALATRKQDFSENQAFELKKDQAKAVLEQKAEAERIKSEDRRLSIEQRTEAAKMHDSTLRAIAQMTKAGTQNKPMTEFQRTNFKQKIAKSQSELRSVEGATTDLEMKANELIAHPGLPAATGVMGMVPSVPGGQAATAEALISEFKAAVKKQGLEMAREGGSIGQMTEREWPIVESMVANIDPVKLGLEGTKAQIKKAVAYAKNLTKRAKSEHADLVSAMPEELQPTVKPGKVNFGDLR